MVLLRFSMWVNVLWGCVPGDGVMDADGPLFFVDEVMMVCAQECAVTRGGGPAV